MKHRSRIALCAGILSTFASVTSRTSAAVIASYDFTSSGDAAAWATSSLNITGLAVSGGLLTGTASNNDPQLKLTTVSLVRGATESWSTVVFRVRETQNEAPAGTVGVFSPIGIVVGVNAFNVVGTITAPLITAVDSGDGFFTVTADISGLAADTITSLRVDPIGGAASNSGPGGGPGGSETTSNTFEVDFIQVNAIPEPGAALLGGLGMLALLRRRR